MHTYTTGTELKSVILPHNQATVLAMVLQHPASIPKYNPHFR